ncbi:MAG: glycosyltransferase [Pseudomonadota bacterium]
MPADDPALDRLSYAAIVATRNRAEALALSLPLLLAQSRLPAEVVVVDSSDDPAPVAAVVEATAKTAPRPVRLVRAKPGLTHQRNVGLSETTAPIVLFPDDDSLLYPDAAERILETYERDREGRLSAIGGREADRPPQGIDQSAAPAEPPPGPGGRLIRAIRLWVDRRLTGASPFEHLGRTLNARHRPPDWLAAANCLPVAYVTGFRMSFRRSALLGFDETLERYAWFEDIDAHLGAMRTGLVVAHLDALVHHHRFPGPRGDGRTIGRWAVLNRAYVAMKHVRANPEVFPAPGREAWRIRLHGAIRVAGYLPGVRSAWGRARLRGALEGWMRVGPLLRADAKALAAAYARASAPR